MSLSEIARSQFRRTLTRAVLLPIVLSAVVGAILIWQIASLLELSEWVTHTDRVIEQAQHTLRLHIDMETGFRGFVITGRETFLEPYARGRAHIGSAYHDLAELVSDNPPQVARVRETERITADWVEYADRVIEIRRGGENAAAVVAQGRGKELTDRVRSRFDELIDIEEDLRDARSEAAQRGTHVTLGLTLGLALLVGIGLAYLGRHQVRALADAYERAELETHMLNETLERRIHERTQALQQANAELEAFSYTVSHDLKAPLRAMQGFAHALLEDYGDELPEDGREYVARIVAAGTRMDELVRDLLEYSRLGRDDLALRPVSLQDVVAGALESLEAEIRLSGARIEVQGDLPSVSAHRPTLVRIVANLVGNAVKFVERGVVPEIAISAERRGERRVRLVIADKGIGIEPQHQERIFRVFERLHGVEQYAGTGIGLAIVRRGVERMGGTSGVASGPGAGSRFWIELNEVGTHDGREPHDSSRRG